MNIIFCTITYYYATNLTKYRIESSFLIITILLKWHSVTKCQLALTTHIFLICCAFLSALVRMIGTARLPWFVSLCNRLLNCEKWISENRLPALNSQHIYISKRVTMETDLNKIKIYIMLLLKRTVFNVLKSLRLHKWKIIHSYKQLRKIYNLPKIWYIIALNTPTN